MATMHVDLRNILAQAIIDYVGPDAVIRLYTAGATLLLAEGMCDDPFAPAPSGGVITVNPIADGTGLDDGDAAVGRIYTDGGVTLVFNDLTVGDSNSEANLKLAQEGTTIETGIPVIFDSLTLAIGNA